MQGLYGYFNRNLRGRKGQQGFTLIELLVVVTILGVLAAIVTLSLVGLTTNAQAKACSQEYKTVQAALDAFMANNNLSTIATGANVSDMTTPVKLYNNGTVDVNNPTYIRNTPTQYAYTWDAGGKITVIATKTGGPTKPDDCKPAI
jgi:prepilin-type N-terminal cleavage/methylation domain-containing protein